MNSYYPWGGFGFGFGLMSLLFPIVFGVVFILFIVVAVRGIREWSHNNAQPQVPARARVVAKRQNVSHHHHNHGTNHGMHTTHSTSYYVTFEFENGQRLELPVPDRRYGLMAEGDEGVLTFQGTRFISFER